MSKCAMTLLQLTTFQLLDKLVKQRYKLALNLRVNFLCGCIIIKVRGLVASIQQYNPRLFIVNQAIRERLTHRCFQTVQFSKALVEQKLACGFPRQLAGELKALDYTIANDFGRILLLRLHAFT